MTIKDLLRTWRRMHDNVRGLELVRERLLGVMDAQQRHGDADGLARSAEILGRIDEAWHEALHSLHSSRRACEV